MSFTCSCGGVVWSHVCGPPCCSSVLGSCGVSVAPFCRLGLLRALPCRVFTGRFLWFSGPSSWSFLGLFPGVLSSRFQWLLVARGSSWIILGYPSSVVCYPGVLSRACRLAPLGLRCLWVPRSCGVHGLRDGDTCLRSGLWSSSVHDRSEAFPSLWWVWLLTFGRDSLPQAASVFFGLRLSRRLSLLLTGCSCSFALGSSSLDLVWVGGFNRLCLLCIPSGCGHPLGQ